jgi:hypothetical protein
MAIYPYKCRQCGKTEEVVQSIASYCKDPIRPEHCLKVMDRVFTVPMVAPDTLWNKQFVSHVDGSVITSRSELREHNARNGVVNYDDVKDEIPAKRKEIAKQAEVQRKSDIVEALHMVDAGYKPQVDKVTMDSPQVDKVNVLEGVT